MTQVLVDTSILIKWFHSEGESETAEARAVHDAHVRGEFDAYILDLALYEVGNVLVRALRWDAVEVADQLDDLLAIVSTPLVMTPQWLRDAAKLAKAHAVVLRRELCGYCCRAGDATDQCRSPTAGKWTCRIINSRGGKVQAHARSTLSRQGLGNRADAQAVVMSFGQPKRAWERAVVTA